MLGGIIFSACYTICACYLAEEYSGWFISAFQAIGGSLVFIPLSFLHPWPCVFTVQPILGAAYLGICIGIIVYFYFNWAMRWVKAGVAGILGNVTPICALLLARFILVENFGGEQLACVVLAMCGIVAASIGIARQDQGKPYTG